MGRNKERAVLVGIVSVAIVALTDGGWQVAGFVGFLVAMMLFVGD